MLLPALERVLTGCDPTFVAAPPDSVGELEALGVGKTIDDDVALVATTSGTTGPPKGALLSAATLTASAVATHDRLGGPGGWLLALPPYHIAGIQVLVRSLIAGRTPVELDVTAGFDVAQLPTAVVKLGAGRRYASLVAAQLAKAFGNRAATSAIAELDAVLLGGGPAPRPVLDAAAEAGITVVRTYGMSETAGGCVYDGVALDDRGVLTVLGRADDAISTGGLTVLPQPVEAALSAHPAVGDCAGLRCCRCPAGAAGSHGDRGARRLRGADAGCTARTGDAPRRANCTSLTRCHAAASARWTGRRWCAGSALVDRPADREGRPVRGAGRCTRRPAAHTSMGANTSARCGASSPGGDS